MASELTRPLTAAERAALSYLQGFREPYRGGDFVAYYEARHVAGGPGRDAMHITTGRRHAWRRTGGAVLRRLAVAGAVECVGFNWGTALYRLTPAGRAAMERADA